MKGKGRVTKKELNRTIYGRGEIKKKQKDSFKRKATVKPYKRQNKNYLDDINDIDDLDYI